VACCCSISPLAAELFTKKLEVLEASEAAAGAAAAAPAADGAANGAEAPAAAPGPCCEAADAAGASPGTAAPAAALGGQEDVAAGMTLLSFCLLVSMCEARSILLQRGRETSWRLEVDGRGMLLDLGGPLARHHDVAVVCHAACRVLYASVASAQCAA
jgi:hypothetical protein